MKKIVNYKVSGEEWTKAKDEAFAKIVKKAKVDGFRQGKVPRSVFEKKYGTGDIISEAMEKIVDAKYGETIVKEKLIPVVEPKLEIEKANDDELEFKITFILDPEVKLGEYKGLKVKKEKVKVTKEEVEHEIEHLRSHYAENVVKEGKVEDGDIAIIDFEGFKDGVAFEGGKGENYPLTIGSHSFIPGFEEQLIGMEANEEKDINVTFPEDYHSEDLKGKEVVFKVKVNEVKTVRIPELDEDFFEDLGMDGINSKESLEKQIEENLKTRKEADAENKYIDELLEAAAKNVEVSIPDAMIKDEQDRMIKQYEQNLQMQGLSLEQFFKFTNSDEQALRDQMKEEATKRVTFRLMLEEIIVEEKIVISDEEADKEAVELSKKYQMEKDEFLKQFGGIEMIKYDLEMRKAIDVLKGE